MTNDNIIISSETLVIIPGASDSKFFPYFFVTYRAIFDLTTYAVITILDKKKL